MPEEIVGQVPGFTEDTPLDKTGTEVNGEKETPTENLPSETKPAKETSEEKVTSEETPGDDTKDTDALQQAVQALEQEKENILKDIVDLRGERRDLKEKKVEKIEEEIDELKDLHPDDIAVIDRVLKAKGYVQKTEMRKEIYEDVKQQEVNKFLKDFPEYKPENDASDSNWNALQKEMAFYALPKNPRMIGSLLKKAHKALKPFSEGSTKTETQKKQLQTAGVGSGGKGSSSSLKSFDPDKVASLSRGGFTDEEIKNILSKQKT